MLQLVYQNDAGERVTLPLNPSEQLIVGRNPGSGLQTKNPSVSRKHARLFNDGTAWLVEDLGSSNKTFVNGTEIRQSSFEPGDNIRFGDLAVKVQLGGRRRSAEREAREDEAEKRRAERRRRRESRRRGESQADEAASAPPREASSRRRERAARAAEEPAPQPAVDEADLDPRERRRRERERRLAERRSRRSESRSSASEKAAPPAPEPEPEPRRPEPEPRRPEPEPEPEPELSARERRRLEREKRRSARDAAEKKVAPPKDVEDPGEGGVKLRRAQRELDTLRGRLDEYQNRIDELETRCRDLESREERQTEELDGWHERYNRAREQVDHAQRLLEESREDLSEKNELVEELEAKVSDLEAELAGHEANRAEGQTLVGELKTKVVQKDRRIDELQRELDLMEYDLRQAREELDALQDSFNHDNSEQRKLDRELQLLREVISEKENVISQLKLDLEEQSREIYDLKLGTGVRDLEEAKRDVLEQFFEKNREVDALQEKIQRMEHKLKEARANSEELEDRLEERKDITQHPDFLRKQREVERALADAAEAQEETERIRSRLDEFGPEARSKMEAQIHFLERKNDALQEKLDEAKETVSAMNVEPAAASHDEDVDDLKERLQEAKGDITDLEDEIGELKRELEEARAKPAPAPTRQATGQVDIAKVAAMEALEQLSAVMDIYTGWKVNINLLKTYVSEAEEEVASGGDIGGAVDSISEVLQVLLGDASDLKSELKELESILDRG